MPAGNSGDAGSGRESPLGRRAVLLGGLGTTVLRGMPDMAGPAPAAGPRYFFLYGTPGPGSPGAAGAAPAAGGSGGAGAQLQMLRVTGGTLAPVSVQAGLAATPVLSPDGTLLATAGVTMAAGGARVTVRVLSKVTGTATRTATAAVAGVAADTGILVTPAFSPDSRVVCLVIAVTTRTGRGSARKANFLGGGTRVIETATLRSRHLLAYLDLGTGALSGPYDLGDEGTLALSTAVATTSELFLWTTRDPQALNAAKGYRAAAPLPGIAVFPFGEREPRLTVPSLGPWPGGEPAVALSSGGASSRGTASGNTSSRGTPPAGAPAPGPAGEGVARLVNARTVQVVAAAGGDLTEFQPAPLSGTVARPSPATMAVRPDGTLLIAKAATGRAVVLDPARGFRVTSDISFPAPRPAMRWRRGSWPPGTPAPATPGCTSCRTAPCWPSGAPAPG
ncbi:MAG TPA: hypothetical protein VH478_23085 [Trebonia sp.]|nr:hypothetical protein [Trebonia sp.]